MRRKVKFNTQSDTNADPFFNPYNRRRFRARSPAIDSPFLFQLNRRGAGARREGDRNQHSLESTLLIQRLVRTLC